MKKNFMKLLIIFSIFLVTGCVFKNDASKFKKEYESLNGKTNASGVEFRKLDVDKKNPYVYINAEDVVKKIENNETFFLYIGDKQCPWCRSVIESSIEVSKEFAIKKIYYVNIWDDDHNEILRDKYELDENNNPVLKIKGTDAYKSLLTSFDSVLRDYTLTTKDGETISVGEKRIFAPSYVFVKEGKAAKLVTGISSLQKNSNEPLTEEMIKETKASFRELFALSSTCDESC